LIAPRPASVIELGSLAARDALDPRPAARAEAALLAAIGAVLCRVQGSHSVALRVSRRDDLARRIDLECPEDAPLSAAAGRAEAALGGLAGWAVNLESDTCPEWANPHLLDAAWVLLREAERAPSRALGDLPLLDADQATAIVSGFNRTADDASTGLTIADVFETVAARAPGDAAVIHDGVELSYAELNRRANQLAHALRASGVSEGEIVGVALERSVQAVLALLAVTKAGAAWMAIDPALPPARVGLMLSDAGLKRVITQRSDRGALPAGVDALTLEDLAEGTGDEPAHNPTRTIAPDSPAYVIYTSGSTGRPKGVVLGNAGAVNMALGHAARLRLRPRPRILQFFSLSFDASVFEVLVPLLTGGAIAIAPRDTLMDPGALTEFLQHHRVQSIQLPPAVLAALSPDQLTEVETVLIGGEVYPAELVARWSARHRVLNFYGPSETTVSATCHERTGPGLAAMIGRPLPNVRTYVLDARRRPVPIGAPGELYIGGLGVGAGYLNRPELSRERFLADPFVATPGARMYRTGDRARYHPDGNLEFLGRADTQVKVRGFRVELQEVEAMLAGCSGVAAAAAAVRDEDLVAFVEPEPERAVDLAALRAELEQLAPQYMIPSRFAVLAQLPRTPNGKLDRGALPVAAAQRRRATANHVAPRTDTERAVAEIISEVLGLEQVSLEERFCDLGGHSLAALKVASRVRDRLAVELRLSAILDAPSLEHTVRAIALAPPRASVLADQGPLNPALSPGQEALWLLQQSRPESVAYNVPWVTRMRGALDREALVAAVAFCVGRHAPLCSRIGVRDGAPCPMPAAVSELAIQRIDATGLAASQRDHRLRELADELVRRPFALARELPLRAALVGFSDLDHALIVVIHHVAADGWSFGVLARELAAAYEMTRVNLAPRLPPLATSYASQVASDRRLAAAHGGHAEDLEFWRAALAGAPPLTRLPCDRPRPAVRDERGGRARLVIDAGRVRALNELATRTGSTLFGVLTAAVSILLVRHGADEDVVLGTVVANRERRDVEGLVGYFANSVPIRVDTSSDPSVLEMIERARRAILASLDHRRIPFDALVRGLNPPRTNASPIFQVLLVLQSADVPPLSLPDLQVEGVEIHSGAAKFDLTIELDPVPDGLAGWLEYSADLFDHQTAVRLASRLVCVLESITTDAERPISRVTMIGGEEASRMRREAQPRRRFEPDTRLPDLFEAQAAAHPARIALTFEGEAITYAQLEDNASVLAAQLRELGVGPEDRVALVLERSLALVTACLGVLKAGGAYVPIDPSYPEHRRDFMLSDCGAAVVIVDAACAQAMAGSAPTVVAVDAHGLPIHRTAGAVEPPPRTPGPHDVAYVIYTSGTTGQPKGVQITHHNVVRLMKSASERFHFGPSDVWTLFHSYAFDVSVWEMWGAFAFGGTLVVVPHLTTRSPDAFHALVRSAGVTVLCQTPSAFSQWMQSDLQIGCAEQLRLRYVITAGEPLSFRGIAPWFARHGDEAPLIVNMYGITETTVHSTFRVVRRDDAAREGSFIGEPLSDLTIYLVDRHGQLVPDGAPGELWVAGDGVGLGYLNQPELSAQRFLRDPFSAQDRPVYRSGDLARRSLSGDLEYLGRIDNQVKIRGFRVELEEIEACISSYPGVRKAAVAIRDAAEGARELVAWIASDGGLAVLVRDYVRARLPDYMVPSRLIELAEFPLTPTGKTDKRALPLTESTARSKLADRLAPRTLLEQLIASVWQDVLSVPEIGVNESFFDVGGHSLLATKVVMRLRRMLDVELPVRCLLEKPTIADLAVAVEQLRRDTLQVRDSDFSAPQLIHDAVLDKNLRPTAARAGFTRGSPRTILLTGATGFLGGYLLAELLRAFPAADLWCLVRCRDADHGRDRVVRNLASYELWDRAAEDRIRIVPSDLARPALGLSTDELRRIVREVDAIYHNGAHVSFLESYERLRPANVLGTEELLRVACSDRTIPFHYVSSTGVFGTPAYREKLDTIDEDDDIQLGLGVGHIGYVQSKWVAERMVWQAAERGLPVTVQRCGLVMGDSRTGHTNLRDFPSMLIKGCLALGAAYELRKIDNFIPVDIASRAIVHISRQPDAWGKAYHVVNPHHVAFTQFWDDIRALGYRLDRVSYAEWIARFFAQPGGPETNPIFPLISLFVDKVPAAGRSVIELFEDQPAFGTKNFTAALAGSSIECPPIDQRLVETWLSYYRRVGFIPEPAG
jgi:amino acid adenylation domain-containing protein/thioester reductase-like protein